MWPSIKPGMTYAPLRSIVSAAAPYSGPTPAIRPSFIATAEWVMSPVKTLTTWPLRNSRSAGASPRATARNPESFANLSCATATLLRLDIPDIRQVTILFGMVCAVSHHELIRHGKADVVGLDIHLATGRLVH